MREVMNTRAVCEAWRDQNQWHARNHKNTLFFRDRTLFSYGDHYPIARHHSGPGGRFVLMNCERSTQTTGKHWMAAFRSLNYGSLVTVVRVPDLFPEATDHNRNLDWFKGAIFRAAGYADPAPRRGPSVYELVIAAEKYAALFGIDLDVGVVFDRRKAAEPVPEVAPRVHSFGTRRRSIRLLKGYDE